MAWFPPPAKFIERVDGLKKMRMCPSRRWDSEPRAVGALQTLGKAKTNCGAGFRPTNHVSDVWPLAAARSEEGGGGGPRDRRGPSENKPLASVRDGVGGPRPFSRGRCITVVQSKRWSCDLPPSKIDGTLPKRLHKAFSKPKWAEIGSSSLQRGGRSLQSSANGFHLPRLSPPSSARRDGT